MSTMRRPVTNDAVITESECGRTSRLGSYRFVLSEFSMTIGLEPRTLKIKAVEVLRNASPARLYEDAVARERAAILASGALATFSGSKTGRSPKDKRIVANPESSAQVWWGPVNIPASHESCVA